jgi:type IV pilus assembly protein PilO
MDLSLTKLPWYAQIGVFVLLACGAAGGYYYYYEVPARGDLAVRATQLKALRAGVAKGLATAKKLEEFRREVEDLETRLSELRAVLPEEKDAADLLRRMQTVAAQSSLTIKSFKPSPVVMQQLHAEWPIALELDGAYHNLAVFFDRVGKFTRIVNISGLDMKARDKPEGRSTLTATCVATTFVLLDAPDRAKAAKPGRPGARPAAKPAPAKKAA